MNTNEVDADLDLDDPEIDSLVATIGEVLEIRPEPQDRNNRLDKFLAARLENLSRTWIQRLIDDGHVLVDGQLRSRTFKMTPGQVVTVTLPPIAEDELQAENIPITVVYQDDEILAIDKPAGMVVHPAPGHRSGTLVNAILHYDPAISMAGSNRPGIVHRLDRDTSGLIVVARTDAGRMTLLEQWSIRSVEKEYIAVIRGVPAEDEFAIDVPIGRDPKQRNRMAAIATGKSAQSHVLVLERFKDAALVLVTIATGRTHQIRVHLAHAGYPIVGDRVYNRFKGATGGEGSVADRQMLHAFRLAFNRVDGERVDLSAPLPADIEAVLAEFRDALESNA